MFIGARASGSRFSYFTECNDALLKGLSLVPASGGSPPLQTLNISPVTQEVLDELNFLSRDNTYLEQLLKERKVGFKDFQAMKQ